MQTCAKKITLRPDDGGPQMLGFAIIGAGLSLFWLAVGISIGLTVAHGALP